MCEKSSLMGPLSTTVYTIKASSNDDNIDKMLSTEDDLRWQPDDSDIVHQITVTIADKDKPITDVIMKGSYQKFEVTIVDSAGDRPITNKVASALMSFHLLMCNIGTDKSVSFVRVLSHAYARHSQPASQPDRQRD